MSIIKYTEFIKEGYETKNEDGKDKKIQLINETNSNKIHSY